MLAAIRPAIVSTVLFTLLLGLAYPLSVTGLAAVLFPAQAQGSLLRDGAGRIVGSALMGQAFSRPEYLHPRPSAAGPNGYDATSSGGSNLGPLSPDLAKRVAKDAAAIRASDGHDALPDDAVTASGSGLDPDISPAYALLQVDRIARARSIAPDRLRALIESHIAGPNLGFMGQPRVNVLLVNRALDARWPMAHP